MMPPRNQRIAPIPAKAPDPTRTPRIKPEAARRVNMNI